MMRFMFYRQICCGHFSIIFPFSHELSAFFNQFCILIQILLFFFKFCPISHFPPWKIMSFRHPPSQVSNTYKNPYDPLKFHKKHGKCEKKEHSTLSEKLSFILPSATGYVQYTMTSFAAQQFEQKVFVVFGARASVTNKYFPYFGRTSIRILVTICFAWNTLKTCMDYTVSNHFCFVLFLILHKHTSLHTQFFCFILLLAYNGQSGCFSK